MNSKEKPTLGGTRIKTRKRNIAVPLDTATFADAVVQIYNEHKGDLELIAKDVDSSELDFSRYGETFFEVVFTGEPNQPGTTKPEEGERHPYSVLNCDDTRESILPVVLFLQKIIRRRPFMIKTLENVMKRLLQSLKLSGLPPETIFSALMSDALIAKGIVLYFVTDVFKVYLVENSLDDLVSLLKRAKMDDRLLDLFPMQKRSIEAFAEHFDEYNTKKVFDVKLKELLTTMTDQIAEDVNVNDVVEMVKQRRKEAMLPDVDVVRTIWDAIMDAVQWSGKNQQQNSNLALRQVKQWGKLLGAFCTTARLEMDLMYNIQIHCYEDAKLMKLFPDIIRALYNQDVLAEDTILKWFKKGTNPKSRQTFVKGLEPFVKWLEEAEEED
uniref:W2 domain-containing protein n=1 Tax=Physcomitrium patens TaxID=3218 RepID=A0A7I4C3H3_PHYPA